MRGLRHYGPFLLLFLVGLSGFSTLAVNRASADAEGDDTIPNQAIRIRIIANSDSDRDQKIKREVRDEVAALIESWGEMPATIEEARALIRSHLPEVGKAADKSLKRSRAGYGQKTELAVVEFPAKTFEGKDYPAGKYEALRITLGEGGGANWWCVLFPPLCLTASVKADDGAAQAANQAGEGKAAAAKADKGKAAGAKAGKGEAVAAKSDADKGAAATKAGKGKAATVQAVAHSSAGDDDGIVAAVPAEKPKAEFFLWVLLKKLISFISSLFA
ncbi:stage II sporulation protein R [Cohnella sp. 56]|uniref:stage II sporulation protein R n=1 Tax=Cohnella sp. 56 TaxID=3113722 RepID=UPI0030E8D0C5